MALTIRPLHPVFAATVSGLDMREPPDARLRGAIIEAADRYAVLVFPGQTITDAQHVAFSEAFGRLETTIKAYRPGFQGRLDPRVADISNLDETSSLLSPTDRRRMSALGNRLWHTDYTFKPTPGLYSLLSARVIPAEGGETQFTDLRAAWDALPDRMKRRLEGLVAEHSLLYSRHARLHRLRGGGEGPSWLGAAALGARASGIETEDVVPGLPRHDDTRDGGAGRPHPAPGTDGPRHAARVRVHPRLDGGRPRAVGQSLHHAPCLRIRSPAGARTAPHHRHGTDPAHG